MKMTLVFSGSGALYPAHLGAASAYYDKYGVPGRLVGVSGGALMASLLSTGKNPHELMDFMLETLPSDVLRANWFKFFWRRKWGIMNLKKLHKILKVMVPEKFSDCPVETHIVCTNIDEYESMVYGPSTPNEYLANIACASASIPFVFSPREDRRGNLLVDGGLGGSLWADGEFDTEETVGILLSGTSPKKSRVTSLLDYTSRQITTMLEFNDENHLNDIKHSRVVKVSLDWSSMNFFELTKEKAIELYKEGRKQTLKGLK